MRAGKLDRQIVIERVTTTLSAAGTPIEAWATLVTLRAEKLDDAMDEHIRAEGASTERMVSFQSRYFPGVTVADRLSYEGQAYNLLHLKEIGRRRGLELR